MVLVRTGRINREQFSEYIVDFCNKHREWKVVPVLSKHSCPYACTTKITSHHAQAIELQVHLLFSITYQVPTIYFQAHHFGICAIEALFDPLVDGTPCSHDEVAELFSFPAPKNSAHLNAALSIMFCFYRSGSTLQAHPHLGTPFFQIHACNTPAIMDLLAASCEMLVRAEYIEAFLDVYGRSLRLVNRGADLLH